MYGGSPNKIHFRIYTKSNQERGQIENSRLRLVIEPTPPFIFILPLNGIAGDVFRNSNGGTTYYFEQFKLNDLD